MMKKLISLFLSPTPLLARLAQALTAATTVGAFYFELLPESYKTGVGVAGFLLVFVLNLFEKK